MRNRFFAGPGLSCPENGSHQGMTKAVGEFHYAVEMISCLEASRVSRHSGQFLSCW